ncbi:YdbL family protein [Pseudodesulfovibrio sp. zrk46]|uniref:YdbL family protein n=1 Tax=Pseudodesulfovibrio sp. zrk46 TaxID=2725288 RepID=UPI0014496908|nr:YdbL family protein [Pseudodesulfovibrio sp. zrk46]QJB56627.1 YdbL family protein [Pseudodesulfovibrio sp. zrk46]
MPNKKHIIALVTMLICLLAATAQAQGIKDRMKARVPAIQALQKQGIVGENNQGYLEFRGPQQQADLVAAENADRAKVYAAIAKKTGAAPAVVGQRSAAKFIQIVPPGSWVQNPQGQWYQK